MTRRSWLRSLLRVGFWSPIVGLGYGLWEASRFEVTRTTIPIPNLPQGFDGLTVAVLSDIHHGPMTGLDFIRKFIRQTNELRPDVIAMPGDFVCSMRSTRDYFQPCFAELRYLTAPLGVYCTPGNHDHWEQIARYRSAVARTSIQDLTNRGVWLERNGSRLRLAGVDDLWCGQPDLQQALGDCTDSDVCVMLCHNPDFVERMTDRRVGLVLSGHMHGGQVLIPFMRPRVPSEYGSKYLKGLIQGPATQVYVSRGLGTVSLPVRFRALPEIALLKLVRGS